MGKGAGVILSCRSCGSYEIKPIVSLGFTPLANALTKGYHAADQEERYPLDLVFCNSCSLVQLVETVPSEKLFSNYFYTSSVSKTITQNAKTLTEKLIDSQKLNEKSLVVEIGSNDGYLLKNYVKKAIKVLGVEPAKNLAEQANKDGINTINVFFNEVAGQYLKGQADVVHANNVIAHVAELNSVVKGIESILKPDGIAVIETHYVKPLFEQNQFDCIYHEHLCYYSVTSLANLFRRHGLFMFHVEQIPIHGGSLRAYFKKSTEGIETNVLNALDMEERIGMDNPNYYSHLAMDIIGLKQHLLNVLNELKAQGKIIAAYGATAKSTTLLNCFGIGKNYLEYVVDATKLKQGLFTPGSRVQIFDPSIMDAKPPDYVLLLAWNFADEIIEKEKEYRENGGKFIIPIPTLKIV